MRLLIASAVVIAIGIGCATGEAIDDSQTTGGSGGVGNAAGTAGKVDDPNGGGAGSSNAGASNGGTSNGGTGNGGTGNGGDAGAATGGVGGSSASGGAGGSTGGSGGQQCGASEKLCGGICIGPQPGVGCSLADCTPCAAPPANSTAFCNGTSCDFSCDAGFTKQGGQCVSTGSGGTGGSGTGGTGGGTGCPQPCDPSAGEQQFICTFLCATQGKFGACAPGINCCVCV